MRSCFGGSLSAVQRKISSPETGKMLCLNPEDLRQIRKTWFSIPDKEETAARIFRRVIAAKPELALAFGSSTPGRPASAQFQKHARSFAGFIDTVVAELSEEPEGPEALIRLIRELGLRHCQVRSVSFTAENWLLLKSSVLEVVCGLDVYSSSNALEPKVIAWSKLLMFLIGEMKDAYLMGIRRNTWAPPSPVKAGLPEAASAPSLPIGTPLSSSPSSLAVPASSVGLAPASPNIDSDSGFSSTDEPDLAIFQMVI